MLRIGVIPYNNLDEQMELALDLRQKQRNNKIKSFHDLGNCFLIYLHKMDKNTR